MQRNEHLRAILNEARELGMPSSQLASLERHIESAEAFEHAEMQARQRGAYVPPETIPSLH